MGTELGHTGTETRVKRDLTTAFGERKTFVSIIAPVYNEETVLPEFVTRIVSAVAPIESRYEFEIILIDDGSRDRSLEIAKALIKRESRLRVIELRRNYGQ